LYQKAHLKAVRYMNTVYISRKKQFTKSDWRQIFQGENKCDSIQFLIERGFFDSIQTEDVQCMAQIFLPCTRNCKFYPLRIQNELYDNKYRMILPITKALTRKAGTVEITFIFFNPNIEQRIKTDLFKFEVFPSADGCDIFDDGESDELDLLENLQKRIEALEQGKADRVIYNSNDDTIQLYSGDVALDEPTEIYYIEEKPDISENEEIVEYKE